VRVFPELQHEADSLLAHLFVFEVPGVVGDLIADEYLFGRPARISREAPVLILRFTEREVLMGGAANAAHNVAALGARVVPVGVVGEDAAGAVAAVGGGRQPANQDAGPPVAEAGHGPAPVVLGAVRCALLPRHLLAEQIRDLLRRAEDGTLDLAKQAELEALESRREVVA
jgi:hypothetical protein